MKISNSMFMFVVLLAFIGYMDALGTPVSFIWYIALILSFLVALCKDVNDI